MLKNINQELVSLLILGFIFIIVLSAGISFYFLTQNDFNWQSNIVHQAKPKDYRLLDGQAVNQDRTNLKPIAIILENHYEARPISGLEQASIIYETIIEGDITRFLAIFDYDFTAKKIGPVRSVRPFSIELAEEWDPILFHAGGSRDAMYKLTYSPVYNIDEISGDGIYFWRDSNRNPPHNLYTSASQMKRAITAKEVATTTDFVAWQFKADDPVTEITEAVLVVDVPFSDNPLYQVEYRYDSEINNYTRYLNNQVHKTDKGIFLKAKNIVVQHVDYNIIDDYGRLEIDLKNGGDAEVYQDGKVVSGYWQRKNGRTRFYNQDDQEIKFNRGTIWVELVFW